jgi:hypothetical protein
MKTKRHLNLEKLAMVTPAPPTILKHDNVTLTFAAFVTPGPHYFYFV